MNTPRNVIILTSGLAGSSVLASMLASAGYWTGTSTVKKNDYDTSENSELVLLNKKLLSDLGFRKDWMMTFDENYVDFIATASSKTRDTQYERFVEVCNRHSPWVWKDPRLWLTIRYWQNFINFSNTVFLTVRRDPLQAWISSTLRRKIKKYSESKNYRAAVHQTNLNFIEENNAMYADIVYEDLLMYPKKVIDRINHAANTTLSVADFRSVFRGTPNRKKHGIRDLIQATAIFLKNYSDADKY